MAKALVNDRLVALEVTDCAGIQFTIYEKKRQRDESRLFQALGLLHTHTNTVLRFQTLSSYLSCSQIDSVIDFFAHRENK